MEKRRFSRINLNVLVNYSTQAIAKTKNISEGGICIVTREAFKKGVLLNLSFSLPNGFIINALGNITWCTQAADDIYESGIEFIDLSLESIEKLKKYINTTILNYKEKVNI